jgi:aryl carrier-like protein
MLDFFQFAVMNQQDAVPQGTARDSLAPFTNNGYSIAGLHSDVHPNDPKCPTVWRRNRKMGLYHNVRAATNTAGSGASGGLKAFLEQAAAADDPAQFLREDANVDYLAIEIGLRIFQSMMRDAVDMDISMSVKAIGLDSLMAIELRRWWKQNLAYDVTVLEIMGAGTLQQLGTLASEGLIAKITESK